VTRLRFTVRILNAALALGLTTTVRAQAASAATPTPQGTEPSTVAAPANLGRVVSPLQRLVSLDLRNVRLETVLDEIDRQTHIGFQYTPRAVPVNKRVSIRVTRTTVESVLRRVLDGTGVEVVTTTAGEVMLVSAVKKAQRPDSLGHGGVWGRVLDTTSTQPIVGAVVSVEATPLTTVSNDSGYFLIRQVPAGVRVLLVRHLGYVPAKREVAIVDSQVVRQDFALRMGMSRLQEVVTTATGQQRKLELGNDITQLNAASIVATQPVTSVTDLLETRVPGLTVQHTSGAPGDPSRLRLRGPGSVLRSNDPIVIVDGVRAYYAQSDARSGNLAASNYAAPSPLDQIDPNSIETIEVLKGPSAATLYGADAANGVIVITTKRGKAGPPQWTVSADRGLSYMPGQYSEGYFRWGHGFADNTPRYCPITDRSCVADSTARFQLLNDPSTTMLAHGARTAVTAGVSGGSAALQYAITGSGSEDVGLLQLPDLEAQEFQTAHGSTAPGWMRRPQDYKVFSGSSRITAQLGRTIDVSLSTSLSHADQQRSSLEGQLGSIMHTYLDPISGRYLRDIGNGFVPADNLFSDYYQRTTDVATTFFNGVNANWRPRSWLIGYMDAGLNLISRDDESVLARDYSPTQDSVGFMNEGHGSSRLGTVNLRGTIIAPPIGAFKLQTTVGANYTSTFVADLVAAGRDIPDGVTSVVQAATVTTSEDHSTLTTFGWYVEPQLAWRQRLFASTGVRFDGGNTYGSRSKLVGFPKVSLSYLLSDEPFFPLKELFSTLRLRAAYGHAGVQPGAGDRLRLYTLGRAILDSQSVDLEHLASLGNTQLKPERSTEFEGGGDADLLDSRVTIGFTGYRKTREDALIPVPLPPSVYGDGLTVLKNVGVVRNTGVELSFGAEVVRTDPVTWAAQVTFSRNRNAVVALGPGVTPFNVMDNSRIQAGYPLYGIWAKPIVSYADVNHDGVIEGNEVQTGDSLVYMGPPEPNYEVTLHTSVALLRGMIRVDAGFDYQNGLTQINQAALGPDSRAFNDPTTPLGEQAAMVALFNGPSSTFYGSIQTVSTLRFNSLAVTYAAPPQMAQRLGASAMSLSLQGTNLGLRTNYRGKDPNVNAYPNGNGILDTGVLPQPRSWQLRVSLHY
jgi:TonB-linked SusC/RagA family outer membrane protein